MNEFKINSNFDKYKKYFLEENSKVNLISRNDEQFLYEKHIYDSLAIKLFFEKNHIKHASILDIGCGGGFPCVPIAIEYPQFSITGIDSTGKKINAVNSIKEKLSLKNLTLICDRVENIQNKKFDIVVSRAVADLAKIAEYALPLLKKNGFFVAYKSRKMQEEIDSASDVLAKYGAKITDIIKYSLPTQEIYSRYLIIIQ